MSKQAVIDSITSIFDYTLSEGIEKATNDGTFHDYAGVHEQEDVQHLDTINLDDVISELLNSQEFMEHLKANISSIMVELDYAVRASLGSD